MLSGVTDRPAADEAASAGAKISAFEKAYYGQKAAGALQSASSMYAVDDLTAALTDLNYGFGTFMDWPVPELARRDSHAFEEANPDHPFAGEYRFVRQEAAAFFRLLAEGDGSLITDVALAALHKSLFDCSAAVRYDVAICLSILGRPASTPHLERLIEIEPDSEGIRKIAEQAHRVEKFHSPLDSDIHISALESGVIATRKIRGEIVGLDVSPNYLEIMTGNGRRVKINRNELAAFQGGGLSSMLGHFAGPDRAADEEDEWGPLRNQVPPGLSVLLDATTVRGALRCLETRTPSPLELLDLATLSTAAVCFENVLTQWKAPNETIGSEFGIKTLQTSRALRTGPLWSVNVRAAQGLLQNDARRKRFETAWADFLGRPGDDVRLDFRKWDQFQDSPASWDGVAASAYLGDMFGEGLLGGSGAKFLAVQTMRSMVNYELASRIGIPYLATSIRSPVQCLIIRENHERQLILDRLITELGPTPASSGTASQAEPFSLEYSAPFILGIILERMKSPDDYWAILSQYRRRFRPLRDRLQKDRENWNGRTGPYVRQMLQRIASAPEFASASEQTAVDASATLVAGALGGVGGASASLAMKLISLLYPADKVRGFYYRWFRPELYLLTSLRNEAESLRALDNRIEGIWRTRWSEKDYRQLEVLCAANPAPFLRLGILR